MAAMETSVDGVETAVSNGTVENNKVEDSNGAGDASMLTEENTESTVEKSELCQKLIKEGLNEKIAAKLEEILNSGKLTYEELDTRAFEALREFPVDGTLAVLDQFIESNLDHVSNKSAYLCGMMKTYRQKQKSSGVAATGTTVVSSTKGPDEEKIKAILERTGYSLDVTTGQRKYGGPPPGWEGPEPGPGSEVFCGKIPKEVFEDELILLFEKSGKIYDLRLMMDPLSGTNRGYAFVTYTTKEEAEQAAKDLDNYEIKPGRKLKVNVSVPNLRLFVGNIPKSKGKEDIMAEFGKLTVGLTGCIIYSSPDDKRKNRGFCFLEYESHKAASVAKKKLGSRPIRVWNCDIIVDWADPQDEPDTETMSKVKVLYVRNLRTDYDEDKIRELFGAHGPIQRIKKLKDYAFVHFEERDHAVSAMNELNGKAIGGHPIEVSLAKPPSDKKKKEEVLRNRERRMMSVLGPRGIPAVPLGPVPGRFVGQRAGGRPLPLVSGDYGDYDYDYYGGAGTAGYGGDYRGAGGAAVGASSYSEPYYEDYYDDYYYDYAPPPPPARLGRGRPTLPPPSAMGAAGRGPIPRGGAPRGRGLGGGRGSALGAGAAGRGMKKGPQGKRKFDSPGAQGDSKRRFQSWGAPGAAGGGQGMNGAAGGEQWYQDSYTSSWQ